MFKSTRKVQYVRQAATGSGDTEQKKVFEVKGCATGCGNLCNLVVWRKCSKAGAFPASLVGFLELYSSGDVFESIRKVQNVRQGCMKKTVLSYKKVFEDVGCTTKCGVM